MYEKDEHGEYKQAARWVDAWAGGGPYVAGWCVCEAREYADGVTRVHRGEPEYLHSSTPEMAALHAVYLAAARGLGL